MEFKRTKHTIKTQLYKTMIHSATCFDPIHIKEVHTYYGTQTSLVTNNVTIQFLYFQLKIKIFVAIPMKINNF